MTTIGEAFSALAAANVGDSRLATLFKKIINLIGATPTTSLVSIVGDLNTLVPSDLSVSGWQAMSVGETNSLFSVQRIDDPDITTYPAAWINDNADTGGFGLARNYYWLNPPGTTSIEVAARIRLPSTGGPYPADWNIPLLVFDENNLEIGRVFDPMTPTWAWNRMILPATALRVYRLKVMLAQGYTSGSSTSVSAAGANGLIADVMVRPIGATGIFAEDFRRIDFNERNIHDNVRQGGSEWVVSGVTAALAHSCAASMSVRTDAPIYVTELATYQMATDPLRARYEVVENGVAQETVLPTTTNVIRQAEQTATAPGVRNVLFRPQGHAFSSPEIGLFGRAMYFPANAYLELLPEVRKAIQVLRFTDSKGIDSSGPNASPITNIDSVQINRDTSDIRIVLDAWGGRTFVTSAVATDADNAAYYITKILESGCDVVDFQLDDNDWTLDRPLAKFQAQLDIILDAILGPITLLGPGTRSILWVLNFTGPVIPAGRLTTPNGIGVTLGQYDTAVINTATARQAAGQRFYAVPADRVLPSATTLTLPDTLHLSSSGFTICASNRPRIIRNAMQVGWVP